MKVAGIKANKTVIVVSMVNGTMESPTRIELPRDSLKVPTNPQSEKGFESLLNLVQTWLGENSPELIVLLKAGSNQYGKQSRERIEIETIIQLAAAQKGINVSVINPKTLTATVKHFDGEVKQSPEMAFNGGRDFKPKELRDAVLAAWHGLWREQCQNQKM